MATAERDYDAARPLPSGSDPEVASLEELQERRGARADRDLADDDGGFLLPDAELLLDDGEQEEPVVPMQSGEFRCTRCFLVFGKQMLADAGGGACRDCS